MQGAKTFDLIYLDEECRVAEIPDKYPNPQFAVLEVMPASALLLAGHSAFASQIRMGDQLAICEAAELESMLTNLSGSFDRDSITQAVDVTVASSSKSGAFRIELPTNKLSHIERLKRWFSSNTPSDERSNRHPSPELIAYHWSGGTARPNAVGNISGTGFYLLTDERPYPGTLIMMTLQRTSTESERRQHSIAVYTKVIRWGPDGVGFAFVAPEVKNVKRTDDQSGKLADQESLQEFLKVALAREQEPTR
ncbi:hypothetical protein P8935_21215 [Telmatobacter sp. DSM 110680]|uniref:PilZ domain-containing protein n=1 Tax=Telmatobacter sp. DSM 110680 TaxID=3036704 RepID=A0AAU7DH78_9BACT